MAQYKVKETIHLGEQINNIGARKGVKVIKDQIVEGNIITKLVFNKNTQGLEYKVSTTIMGQGRPSDGMDRFFIQLEYLEAVTSSGTQMGGSNTVSSSQTGSNNTTPVNNLFTTKNIAIGVISIIAILGILKWQKVI